MKHLFWLDLEMTGLDVTIERIIECAVIITDLDFNVVDQFECVVKQAPELLAKMDDWNKKTHGESGLLAKIPNGISEKELDEQLTALANKYFIPRDKVILCGNSIHQDKLFIDTYLAKFSDRCSYRMIDVSSFKEVFRAKYKMEFKKVKAHQALSDVKESIAELKHYLSFIKIEPLT